MFFYYRPAPHRAFAAQTEANCLFLMQAAGIQLRDLAPAVARVASGASSIVGFTAEPSKVFVIAEAEPSSVQLDALGNRLLRERDAPQRVA